MYVHKGICTHAHEAMMDYPLGLPSTFMHWTTLLSEYFCSVFPNIAQSHKHYHYDFMGETGL